MKSQPRRAMNLHAGDTLVFHEPKGRDWTSKVNEVHIDYQKDQVYYVYLAPDGEGSMRFKHETKKLRHVVRVK